MAKFPRRPVFSREIRSCWKTYSTVDAGSHGMPSFTYHNCSGQASRQKKKNDIVQPQCEHQRLSMSQNMRRKKLYHTPRKKILLLFPFSSPDLKVVRVQDVLDGHLSVTESFPVLPTTRIKRRLHNAHYTGMHGARYKNVGFFYSATIQGA